MRNCLCKENDHLYSFKEDASAFEYWYSACMIRDAFQKENDNINSFKENASAFEY